MTLNWLFRNRRLSPYLFPAALFGLSAIAYTSCALLTEGGLMRANMSPRQLIGTLLMFTLLPTYLLAMMMVQWRGTMRAVIALEASTVSANDNHEWLQRYHPQALVVVLVGVGFGLSQNWASTSAMLSGTPFIALDVAIVVGNCVLWAVVAFVLSWRVPVSARLSRFGEQLNVDLYQLHLLKPLSRVATTDVLLAMGAMALMPLQSLDAEFRIYNYRDGMFVGIGAAVILFVLPLTGVRRKIAQLKAARLETLRAEFGQIPRSDVPRLEVLSAHIDRVRTTPTWPIDLQLVARVFRLCDHPPDRLGGSSTGGKRRGSLLRRSARHRSRRANQAYANATDDHVAARSTALAAAVRITTLTAKHKIER